MDGGIQAKKNLANFSTFRKKRAIIEILYHKNRGAV